MIALIATGADEIVPSPQRALAVQPSEGEASGLPFIIGIFNKELGIRRFLSEQPSALITSSAQRGALDTLVRA